MRYYAVYPAADGIKLKNRVLNAYELFTEAEIYRFDIPKEYLYKKPVDTPRNNLKREDGIRYIKDKSLLPPNQFTERRFFN